MTAPLAAFDFLHSLADARPADLAVAVLDRYHGETEEFRQDLVLALLGAWRATRRELEELTRPIIHVPRTAEARA